ncbi:MAG: hypothetical protein V1744_02420 [Candidatus Altiarchaeota archaeon]
MISRFFLRDKSFRLLSKMMSVEHATVIADMKLLVKFLLKPEAITPLMLKGEVILDEAKTE